MVPIDEHRLADERLRRLRVVMAERNIPALLTADPINIAYASGARNMTVFGMMGPSRFVLVLTDGPVVLFEFAGCEHLAVALPTVDEIRTAPSVTAVVGEVHRDEQVRFATELADECRRHGAELLAVERVDFPLTDALRAEGLALVDAMPILHEARRSKQPLELVAIRQAIATVDDAVAELAACVRPGMREVEMWSELHRGLIARGGEYVSTRLLQSGLRTFPYFQEAGPRRVGAGELVCVDTDAVADRGYAVDFSRTFLCGDSAPTPTQRRLHALAHEQLAHNAGLLRAGRSYEDLARRAWPVPETHRPWGYYCVAHGIGMSGEFPVVPTAVPGQRYRLAGELEAGMTVCVESYIGDPASGQGVKLEDQYLVTETGAECLTNSPFDPALGD